MRSIDVRIVICLMLSAILNVIPGCATQIATLQIKNSLPQNVLAYYCDSFEKMREDLLDKTGYLFIEEKKNKKKLADIKF